MKTNIIWFRHGLRIHDNPALLEAVADKTNETRLLPLFIFDGESAGTKSVGYNRMQFLIDSLYDIDEKFRALGGQLYLISGNPVSIFRRLHSQLGIQKVCFEQDCEPIWSKRDNDVKDLCNELDITVVEKVSHTLWDPKIIINTNGGIAPLTYQMFLHTIQMIGLPPRPTPDINWNGVNFVQLSDQDLADFEIHKKIPRPEDFDIFPESLGYVAKVIWKGGETESLRLLMERLQKEENAFKNGCYLPNQANPNILESPKSMSAHLRFGCLSVRRFYWDVHDLFEKVYKAYGYNLSGGAHITSQLIWREYFYTMSVNNPNYDRMEGNDICLTIPWHTPCKDQLTKWKIGQTGFPLVDASMRQLMSEGWLHHCLRNVVATFLTYGGMWQSWEHGLQHFLKYLLDADWSVCAGNWMWVSCSAFETLLDFSICTCPIALGKRLDPNGEYIKQYVPELANIPKKYIHEPWKTPQDIQEQVECIIGIHYPNRIIDVNAALKQNYMAMTELRESLIAYGLPDDATTSNRNSNNSAKMKFIDYVG